MNDILIAGGGPAGIAAAVTAAQNGSKVLVVDDNPAFGGQIWRQGIQKSSDGKAAKWLSDIERLNIELKASTTVIDKHQDEIICFNEMEGISKIKAGKLILANGARELFLPFPGWTLPGVMGCGGAQAMMKSGMPVKGKKVVVAGSGPLLLAVASSFVKAGAELKAIVEQVPSSNLNKFAFSLLRSPGKLLQGIRYRLDTFKAPFYTSSWVKSAAGKDRLQKVFIGGKKSAELECDILACAYGLVPNSELAKILGCSTEGDFVQVDNSQRTSVENIYAVGEITGIGGVEKALFEGRIAGSSTSGIKQKLPSKKEALSKFSSKLSEVYVLNPELKKLAEDNTVVCRCEDVCYSELKDKKDQRSAKLYTRCGMGACQGRICSASCKVIFGWERNKISAPLIPLPLSAFTSTEE